MSLTEITDHVERAQALLVEQFKGKPKIEALIASYAEQTQDLEAVLFDVLETTIETATGATLDGYGDIVGEERQGRDDDDYRLGIQARILINTGSGTIEQLIAIVNTLIAPCSCTIELTEGYPASFEISVDTTKLPVTVDGFRVATLVQSAKPAGVRAIFRWSATDTPFQFDTSGQGFDQGEYTGAADF